MNVYFAVIGILGLIAIGNMALSFLIWRTAQKQIENLATLHKAKDLAEYSNMKGVMTAKDKIKMVEKQNELALGAEKLAQRAEKSTGPRERFGIGAQ